VGESEQGLIPVTRYAATTDVTDIEDASPSLPDIRLFGSAGMFSGLATRRSERAAQSAIGYYP
jgi:hypothetical protein